MLIHELRRKLNKDKDPSPYDLLPVHIGRDRLDCRAIAWSDADVDGFGHNKKGFVLEQIKWHATCPQCAQLIEFDEKQVAIQDNKIIAYCDTCKINKELVHKIQEITRAKDTNDKVAHLLDRIDEIAANGFYINTSKFFVNPIATGAINVK